MTLVAGFAIVAVCWVAYAYGRDLLGCLVDAYLAVTEGLPEDATVRHEHMRAMDELAGRPHKTSGGGGWG